MTEAVKGLRWVEVAIVAAALMFIPWTIGQGKTTNSFLGQSSSSVESIGSFYRFFLRYDPAVAFPIVLNNAPLQSDATIGQEYGCFVSQGDLMVEIAPSDGECVSEFFGARYFLQLFLAALVVWAIEVFLVSDPQIPLKDKIAKIRARIGEQFTGIAGD